MNAARTFPGKFSISNIAEIGTRMGHYVDTLALPINRKRLAHMIAGRISRFLRVSWNDDYLTVERIVSFILFAK